MKSYITVTQGLSGWFAVEVWFNKELQMWEPWTTGFGRYATREEAEVEARDWAMAEDMEFKP